VTPDEIGDPLDLRIRTYVSGELRQDGHTADMLFNIYDQVPYPSSAFTLEPGDVPGDRDSERYRVAPPRQVLQARRHLNH
jgi:hypothetical protein